MTHPPTVTYPPARPRRPTRPQVRSLDALKLKALAAPPRPAVPPAAADSDGPPALPADFAARWRATLAPLAGLAGLWAGVFAELGRAEGRAGGPSHLPEAALYRVDLGAAWRFRGPPEPACAAAAAAEAGAEGGGDGGPPPARRRRG